MGKSPVSQILQVAASRTEAKPVQPSSSQGEEFQKLLTQASSGVEQRKPATAEATEASPKDEPSADSPEQDATTSRDDQSTTTADAPVLAESETDEAPAEVPSDDVLQDEIELSEAAVFALATQITTETDYSVEAVTDSEVVTKVIDSQAAQLVSPGNDAQPEEKQAVKEFTQTLEVSSSPSQVVTSEQQVVAGEQVVVDPPGSPEQEAGDELPAGDFIAESVEEPAREFADEELAGQVEVTDETAEAPVKPVQAATQNLQAAPIKLPKVAATASEQTEAPLAEEPALVEGEQQELPEKRTTTASNVESSLAKQNVPAADETQLKPEKEETPAPKGPVTTVHRAHDDRPEAATRFAHSSAGQSGASADAADSDAVSTVDRARFVQRVSRAFQSVHGREGTIQLRLSPPELGSLRIAISTHQGVVSAKVEADTAAARNVLLDHLPVLRERLAEQHIRLEKFDVDVRRDGGQESSNWGTQDRQPRQPAHHSPMTTRLRRTATPTGHVGGPLGGVADGSLDVRI